jgi:hypothetical protein
MQALSSSPNTGKKKKDCLDTTKAQPIKKQIDMPGGIAQW